MQEIFEKIIEKLEEELKLADKEKEQCIKENHLQFDSAKGYSNGIANAIEIVKQEAEKYNNGWIQCSERLPEERDWYLAVFEEIDTGYIGIPYIADYLMGACTKLPTTVDGWVISNCSDDMKEYCKNLRCVAWQPLPSQYKPKGE